jgi:hypothetical protein
MLHQPLEYIADMRKQKAATGSAMIAPGSATNVRKVSPLIGIYNVTLLQNTEQQQAN